MKRIVGYIEGTEDNTTRVMTEWFNKDHEFMTGVMIDLEVRGWKETEIEIKEP
jgi:hypothetical protein